MDKFILKIAESIEAEQLIPRQEPPRHEVIVALSGGADSVALLSALSSAGYRCVAAHCDFHLRGEESERDRQFSENIARKCDTTYREIHFDVPSYKLTNGVSTEMACRELRYKWFAELSAEYGGIPIAVGHHREDNEETLFLNLLRGTGIRGITGMKRRNGNIIRPMLDSTRQDIEAYLKRAELEYIVDSSNLVNDVKRNRLRNIVLPTLHSEFPDSATGIDRTLTDMSRNAALYEELIAAAARKYTDGDTINLSAIKHDVSNASTMLFELLRDYGFNYSQAADIIDRAHQSGRQFHSSTHTALIDRGQLIVKPDLTVKNVGAGIDFTLSGPIPEGLSVTIIPRSEVTFDRSGMTLYLDGALLDTDPTFTLRQWQHGDRIAPFGMKGSRKISDLLSDAKLPLTAKQHVHVLALNDTILWVIGMRSSRHFPITTNTANVIRIVADASLIP